jgi:hypothetical protein
LLILFIQSRSGVFQIELLRLRHRVIVARDRGIPLLENARSGAPGSPPIQFYGVTVTVTVFDVMRSPWPFV